MTGGTDDGILVWLDAHLRWSVYTVLQFEELMDARVANDGSLWQRRGLLGNRWRWLNFVRSRGLHLHHYQTAQLAVLLLQLSEESLLEKSCPDVKIISLTWSPKLLQNSLLINRSVEPLTETRGVWYAIAEWSINCCLVVCGTLSPIIGSDGLVASFNRAACCGLGVFGLSGSYFSNSSSNLPSLRIISAFRDLGFRAFRFRSGKTHSDPECWQPLHGYVLSHFTFFWRQPKQLNSFWCDGGRGDSPIGLVLKLEGLSFAWPGVRFDCSDLVGHVVPSMEANTESVIPWYLRKCGWHVSNL